MSTPVNGNEEPVKSKRPKDTKFKQQKLPAWQPILTAGTVLPAFFAIGIAFIPLGVALLVTSNNVQELEIDYTNCKDLSGAYSDCAEFLKNANNTGKTCKCQMNFTLSEPFRGDVFMYYGLTNFFQNHRRYVKSRDDAQLVGSTLAGGSDCDPYTTEKNGSQSIPYAPCGAIANSLFNDSMSLKFYPLGSSAEDVKLLRTGIAWSSDKSVKFNNPPGKTLKEAFKDTRQPPNWPKPVYELDLVNNATNNGYKNEDLIVWMRTAALPNFRKLYRRVETSGVFRDGLPKGSYSVQIEYSYPVVMFEGTKKVILSTTSWMGGKNPFLGIAYLVVGSICIVLGVVFLVIHLRVGKRPQDMINVTNRTAY